jgi:hypothetical protein
MYFHSIITCAAVFISIVSSIMDLIDRITKGREKGSIVHAVLRLEKLASG